MDRWGGKKEHDLGASSEASLDSWIQATVGLTMRMFVTDHTAFVIVAKPLNIPGRAYKVFQSLIIHCVKTH
jgi:hypothetical protein